MKYVGYLQAWLRSPRQRSSQHLSIAFVRCSGWASVTFTVGGEVNTTLLPSRELQLNQTPAQVIEKGKVHKGNEFR